MARACGAASGISSVERARSQVPVMRLTRDGHLERSHAPKHGRCLSPHPKSGATSCPSKGLTRISKSQGTRQSTVRDVSAAVVQQNGDALTRRGAIGRYQIRGTGDGVDYVVALTRAALRSVSSVEGIAATDRASPGCASHARRRVRRARALLRSAPSIGDRRPSAQLRCAP